MTPASKQAFIKLCLEGKATTTEHYIYRILLNNQNKTKDQLIKLIGLNKPELKIINKLIYEGFIYVDENDFLEAITNIEIVEVLHKKQLELEFQRDKDRFIKKHTSKIPEHLLIQLKSI